MYTKRVHYTKSELIKAEIADIKTDIRCAYRDAALPNAPAGLVDYAKRLVVELRTRFPEEKIFFDPDCPYCVREGKGNFCPPHDASEACESGKHSHCTCDYCF